MVEMDLSANPISFGTPLLAPNWRKIWQLQKIQGRGDFLGEPMIEGNGILAVPRFFCNITTLVAAGLHSHPPF